MRQKMPWRRIRNFGLIATFTLLVSFFFAYFNRLLPDGIFIYLMIDAIFLACMLYLLESSRIRGEIGGSASNDYGKIAACYAIFCVITAAAYFLPEFTCPAAAFSLFLCMVSNAQIASGLGIFLCVLLGVATRGSFYELASCCLLTFFGTQMVRTMHEKKNRFWGCVILVSVSLSIPALFYYLAYSKSPQPVLALNGIFGLVTAACFWFISDGMYHKIDLEEEESLELILNENFPLRTDIRNFSKTEYLHALKVAVLAGKCAAEIGADERIASAAGFYYRLGILEGEPFVESGVRLAAESCFPLSVLQILSEYNGVKSLPSSRESAIVHITDACVKRVEDLDGQDLLSSWNQEMVIYQTLNDLSATGIYDKSGLSMNQFLRVRELLVREEIRYDNKD